jgi:pimeloyl-ACP methyl ester carboxylesterase
LYQQKQCLAALPQGSVGPGAVLLALLQGLWERPWSRRSFFVGDNMSRSIPFATRGMTSRVLLWTMLAGQGATALAAEAECVEITIPLTEGRFYSPRELGRQCNEKLRTDYQIERLSDRCELTGIERAALLLADEMGWIGVRINPDRLVLLVPDSQDAAVRLAHRRRLGRLLQMPLEEWPLEKGLHLPEPFDPGARSVLLIHGMESGMAEMGRLADACRRRGVQVLMFDYPNDGPVAWSGERLSGDLADLAKQHPRFRVPIVAHSMGGLVARYSLETPGKNPGCVTDLVVLATPHAGTRLAGLQGDIELIYALLPGPGTRDNPLRDGLGEAAEDLLPASAFLRELNARSRPQGVRYHVAIGRRSFVSEDRRHAFRVELEALLIRRKATDEVRMLALEFLDAEEFRDGRGDGAVAVTSARLRRADSERIFDLNHLELIHLPCEAPKRHEVLRWIADCLGWPD